VNTEVPKNLAASVRQRLTNRARQDQQEFQLVLIRYALERLIFRLSRSPYAERFILKGATLFYVWNPTAHAFRSTFTGCGTTVPSGEIYALTAQFSLDAARQRLWTGFLKRLELKDVDKSFHVVTNQIAVFVNPPLQAASQKGRCPLKWQGKSWYSSNESLPATTSD
jgi:hypothetical protein